MTEFLELNPARKWEYLQRYYEVAGHFFDPVENVVTDEEIEVCIRGFKEKPQPQYRKQILLKNWKFRLDPEDEGVRLAFFAPEYDDDHWENVTAPHSCHYIPEPVRFGRLDCNLVKTDGVLAGVL